MAYMDYSTKVTVNAGPNQENDNEAQADAASPPSNVDLPESAHPCPACPTVLSSLHELTNHLRGHNSPRSTDCSSEDDYCCGVCNKVLSSASSLHRHVLVHSRERPFKCKHCDIAFTTNGNMNRHQRTAHRSTTPHRSTPSHRSTPPHSCTDSEGSSDSDKLSKRPDIEEYNNNEIAKRNSPDFIDRQEKSPNLKRKALDNPNDEENCKRHKTLLNNVRAEIKSRPEDNPTVFNCPVCDRQDFATTALLEAHLERNHPSYEAKCESCNLSFKSHRVLNLHRFMIHFMEYSMSTASHKSVIGFNDLTFVDFSSGKFTAIARAVCEQSVHVPASGEKATFQCTKCLRAFPCRTAVDEHEIDCGTAANEHEIDCDTVSSQARVIDDIQSKRDDFFAGLDLQNKAAMTEAKEGKDLADIQSIISVTSGPILQNFPRSDASTPENNIKFNLSVSSSGSSGTFSSECNEEELQDAFAAEFRKMKLKGEFPCRLCTAIFPNLRALKGHNRAHMGVGPGMPYPCNMCAYTSTDKATVVRHLRTHNGDRPYECSLCNYAFTTKANCERHVRNRHGKLNREDIKNVLIYHPSEDSTTDNVGRNSPRVIKEDLRKGLMYTTDELHHQTQMHYPSVPMEGRGEIRIIEEAKLHNSLSLHSDYEKAVSFPMSGQQAIELTQNADERKSGDIKQQDYTKLEEDLESRSSEGCISLVSDTKSDSYQRIQASPINLKKRLAVSEAGGEDGPLDLSMDVLDLSKKKRKQDGNCSATQDRYEKEANQQIQQQMILTEILLKSDQVRNAAGKGVYPNTPLFYRTYPDNSSQRILPPFFFTPHVFGQELALKERLHKELVRGLQLTSGGTLVEPTIGTAGFNAYPQGKNAVSQSANDQTDYTKLIPSKLTNKALTGRNKPDNRIPSANPMKMVIKNGVLMPKQKQRRYRTERPFGCEHCSARFTLRSNMERHIKQQHPQYWSQRPRGGHSTRGRPPASHPTLLQNLEQTASRVTQSYPNILPKAVPSAEYSAKHPISDQVKYAILAQQLKASKVAENDSEEELVIDEERQEKEQEPQKEKCTSLLRDQLEGLEAAKEMEVEPEECAKGESTNTESANSENANDESKISDLEQSMEASEQDNIKTTFKADSVDEKAEKMEDLASVPDLLKNAKQQLPPFQPQYLSDEEGLVASNSGSSNSGSDEKSDSVNSLNSVSTSPKKKKKMKKKKSAYSMAPNRVICPFCERAFPWTSSLRRHILTHTGQKPYQCVHCSLLFTTKSNCDRHLLRKHKTNPNKIRRVRNSSSPDSQAVINNNNSFSMRNVPERPYKCNLCPSSTFSTLGNLKKHRSTKHARKLKSRSDTPSSEPQNSPQECSKQNEQTDDDSQSSSVSESMDTTPVSGVSKTNVNTSPTINETPRSRRPSPRSSPGPSDVPFKCHLCDCGFSERQDCLEHIKMKHKKSYAVLMAKGALDMDIDTVEDHQQPPPQHHPSDGEEKRGRFPDYSNRKVVCAFCMRRFWSAEDLRRHMRTHTGERPFSCDICCRRFTLKHSMLRHRKKHESVDSPMYVGTSGDEENSPTQPPTITPRTEQQQKSPVLVTGNTGSSRIQERISLPNVAPVATGDAAPSGLVRFHPYRNLASLTRKVNTAPQNTNLDAGESTDNDLISNLLGIPDKNFIDRVLQASADDAAKLLGVKHSHE
ncbi:uncharacterized protein LOC117218773 isoform X1 [Megalopta genalis]|uniref:uncharacterized protein LOC117218773 isoform X1 n=1 Tax=Megalopta genalis TaxID=115081 RepID=UPI003FCFE546